MKPKNKIKLFDKAIELTKLLIEFKNAPITMHFKEPIPEYKKGVKYGSLMVVGEVKENGKETVIAPNGEKIVFDVLSRSEKINSFEEWSKQMNQHLKEKGLHNTEPFAMPPIETKLPLFDYDVLFDKTKTPTAPPLGSNHNFHKQALEAEKELEMVCKLNKELEELQQKAFSLNDEKFVLLNHMFLSKHESQFQELKLKQKQIILEERLCLERYFNLKKKLLK